MNNHKETPEGKRERLRQNELKNNPTGSLRDGLKRGDSGNLTGGLGWKSMGMVIVGIIVGYVLYNLLY